MWYVSSMLEKNDRHLSVSFFFCRRQLVFCIANINKLFPYLVIAKKKVIGIISMVLLRYTLDMSASWWYHTTHSYKSFVYSFKQNPIIHSSRRIIVVVINRCDNFHVYAYVLDNELFHRVSILSSCSEQEICKFWDLHMSQTRTQGDEIVS